MEWTGTADSVTSDIVSSWAATPTLIANAAYSNTPSDLALGASYQQYSFTVTLGQNFTNLILFFWTPEQEAQNDKLSEILAKVEAIRESMELDEIVVKAYFKGDESEEELEAQEVETNQ